MTREEAIELLCAYGVPQDEKRFQEAIDMAIEALSQPEEELIIHTGQTWGKSANVSNSDLISRQDAIEQVHSVFSVAIDETPTEVDEDGFVLCADMETVNKLLRMNKAISTRIKALPSADRPTGEWIEQYDEDAHAFFRRGWICTYCGSRQTYGKPDFCPSCGADMRGEDHE